MIGKLKMNNKIEKFEANKPEEAEFMKAIKWIGNEASHKLNTVTKDDVLDALFCCNLEEERKNGVVGGDLTVWS